MRSGNMRSGSVGPSELCWPGVSMGVSLLCRQSRNDQAGRHPHPPLHPLLTFYSCLPFSPFSQSVIHKRSSVNPLSPHNNLVQVPQPAYLPRASTVSLRRVSQTHQSCSRVQSCPLKPNMYLPMRNCLPLIQISSILSPMVQVPLRPNSRCLSAGDSRPWRPTT